MWNSILQRLGENSWVVSVLAIVGVGYLFKKLNNVVTDKQCDSRYLALDKKTDWMMDAIWEIAKADGRRVPPPPGRETSDE